MANVIPNELLNPNNPINLALASSLTFIISNSLAYVFDWKAKWIGLFISMIISLIANVISSDLIKDQLVIRIIFMLINGFIIYASAVGLSAITMQNKGHKPAAKYKGGMPSEVDKTFLNKWW